MKAPRLLLALATTLLLSATGLFAQSTGTTSGGMTTGTTSTGTTTTVPGTGHGHGKAAPHTPNAHASDAAKAVQAILQQFDASRDQFMAERKALLDKLEAAKTAEERKAILDELKADMKAEKEQRSQLGKQIREEIKNLRQQRKGGGG